MVSLKYFLDLNHMESIFLFLSLRCYTEKQIHICIPWIYEQETMFYVSNPSQGLGVLSLGGFRICIKSVCDDDDLMMSNTEKADNLLPL